MTRGEGRGREGGREGGREEEGGRVRESLPHPSLCLRYGPATQVRWLQDPKPADKAAAAVAKRPASSPAA